MCNPLAVLCRPLASRCRRPQLLTNSLQDVDRLLLESRSPPDKAAATRVVLSFAPELARIMLNEPEQE